MEGRREGGRKERRKREKTGRREEEKGRRREGKEGRRNKEEGRKGEKEGKEIEEENKCQKRLCKALTKIGSPSFFRTSHILEYAPFVRGLWV